MYPANCVKGVHSVPPSPPQSPAPHLTFEQNKINNQLSFWVSLYDQGGGILVHHKMSSFPETRVSGD